MTNGSTTWEHTYNADGLRTRRTDGTDTYEYVYLDGQLVQLTVNNDGTEVLMKFAYDADGTPLSITYKGIIYYYVTNLQGDVVGIVNQSGNLLVSYTYDAWGNILSTTGSNANALGKHNPLRYRGYVYDEGTGLYYLQSRYYDPEMGRFINADAFASTGAGLLGNNMYAYCGNNPVVRSDAAGSMFVIERGGTNPQRYSGNRTFGAGTICKVTTDTDVHKFWSLVPPMTITHGKREVYEKDITGDTSKPISVYYAYNFSNTSPLTASVGVKTHKKWLKSEANLGGDGVQITYTVVYKKMEYSGGISVNPAEMCAEIEWGSAEASGDITTGTYTTVTGNMVLFALLLGGIPVGQGGPMLVPAVGLGGV